MRIISNFKDYYDIGSSLGIDKTIVYQRFPEVYDLNIEERIALNGYIQRITEDINLYTKAWLTQSWETPYHIRGGELSVRLGILGFCGSIYPYFLANGVKTTSINVLKGAFLERYLDKSKFEYGWPKIVEKLQKYTMAIRYSNPLHVWFYKLESPIFTYVSGDDKVKKNVSLGDLCFYNWLDSYQTYQELSMFIGGVLPSQGNKTVEITDDTMLLKKHGMGKMSFRQGTPGEKKQRRKRNKLSKRRKTNAARSKGKN